MASPTARQLLVRALPGLFPDKDPEFRGKAFLEIAQMQSDVAAGLLDLPEEDRRAAIEAAVHRGDLVEKIEALADQVAKLTSTSGRIISVDALQLMRSSIFLTEIKTAEPGMSTSSSDRRSIHGRKFAGLGVCVSAQKAVTAAHNLVGLEVGNSVRVFFPGSEEMLRLVVEVKDQELDYAVLATDGEFNAHLPLYSDPSFTLVGKQLAMCAFQLGVLEDLPDWSHSGVAVLPATGVKLSRQQHHLVYSSDTWPGDSGGALVMYHGELVGLHLCGVNALKEKFEQKRSLQERVSAIEESLESAAQSVASGCIALLATVFANKVQV